MMSRNARDGGRQVPSSRISTGAWARGLEHEILGAVQSALEGSIKIPYWDRDIVIDIYDETTRLYPPNRTTAIVELATHLGYTRVEIGLYAGRSLDAKRQLYHAITRNFAELGVDGSDLKTILIEFSLENCAPHGAEAACDIGDLGYNVEV